MQVSRTYQNTKYPFALLSEITAQFATPDDPATISIATVDQEIKYDSVAEAVNDYRGDCRSLHVHAGSLGDTSPGIHIYYSYDPGWSGRSTRVTVRGRLRGDIEAVLARFDAAQDAAHVAPPEKKTPTRRPTVFIGHGGSPLWRDVKDHLTDQHGYLIEAYETGARAGHQIRDILQTMTKASSFAILVMTGEDEQPSGAVRARQNVVHEVGLFQGALGFDRAIVLFEEGTEEFSNLHGIQQVRFPKGRIRETFGDVLATLRREFGTDR